MRGRRDQQLHFRVSKPELDRIDRSRQTNFGAAGRPMSRNILAKAAAYFYTANGLKRVCKIKGQQGGPDEWIVILCAFSTVTFCLKEQK